AACVHQRGRAPHEPLDVVIAANTQDPVSSHGDCGGCAFRRIAGVDVPVVDNEIDRPALVLPLGADNQSGDERDGHDGGHDKRGETSGHGTSKRDSSTRAAPETLSGLPSGPLRSTSLWKPHPAAGPPPRRGSSACYVGRRKGSKSRDRWPAIT